MKKSNPGTTIWQLKDLLNHAATCSVNIRNKWIPSRPLGRTDIPNKLKAAWLVLTGKADIVVWPGNQ